MPSVDDVAVVSMMQQIRAVGHDALSPAAVKSPQFGKACWRFLDEANVIKLSGGPRTSAQTPPAARRLTPHAHPAGNDLFQKQLYNEAIEEYERVSHPSKSLVPTPPRLPGGTRRLPHMPQGTQNQWYIIHR